jgi:hypothetical protein
MHSDPWAWDLRLDCKFRLVYVFATLSRLTSEDGLSAQVNAVAKVFSQPSASIQFLNACVHGTCSIFEGTRGFHKRISSLIELIEKKLVPQ